MAPSYVLLDLDGTLVDRAAAIRRVVEGLVGQRDDAPAHVERLLALDRDGKAARDLFLTQVHGRLGLPGSVDDLHRWYAEHLPAAYAEVDARTREALERLRAAGARIAVVTNGERYQHAVARLTGLGPLIDAMLVSELDGARKPDRRAFWMAAKRVEAEFPGDGWMIGDDPLDDIAGARAAGLRGAWIRRGRSWPGGIAAPELEVDDVAAAVDGILATG